MSMLHWYGVRRCWLWPLHDLHVNTDCTQTRCVFITDRKFSLRDLLMSMAKFQWHQVQVVHSPMQGKGLSHAAMRQRIGRTDS
jgi:hypothetical protein